MAFPPLCNREGRLRMVKCRTQDSLAGKQKSQDQSQPYEPTLLEKMPFPPFHMGLIPLEMSPASSCCCLWPSSGRLESEGDLPSPTWTCWLALWAVLQMSYPRNCPCLGYNIGLHCCQFRGWAMAVVRSDFVRKRPWVEPIRSLHPCHYGHFVHALIVQVLEDLGREGKWLTRLQVILWC